METKTARNIMRSIDACMSPHLTLDKVSDHLSKHHLTGVPVVDENSKLIGFISEYDCVKQLIQSAYYCDNTALAQDVMNSSNFTSCRPDISVVDLAAEMNKNTINVMPVVEDSIVLGVVSRGDVMRELVQNLDVCAIP
ncbi:MAG: CBS domain-containing protein [Arenicella sp.]|jgi:CBS domain-containing protein